MNTHLWASMEADSGGVLCMRGVSDEEISAINARLQAELDRTWPIRENE